jgi:hypothetical protein
MLAKLAILILAAAATSAGLLSVRQQQLQAVHDTARAVEAAARLDRQLWSLRAELADLTSPARVQALIDASDTARWRPIRSTAPRPEQPPQTPDAQPLFADQNTPQQDDNHTTTE